MKPHTALLCDAHVWALAECPICALEREITKRESAAKRIEELKEELSTANWLIDSMIDADWKMEDYKKKAIINDMRKARGEG